MAKVVCDFIDAPEIKPPDKAIIWTHFHYCDMAGWYSLPDHEKLELKMTTFDDGRFLFLDQVYEVPQEVTKIVSGEYDIKTWGKENNFICVEADKSVYIKIKSIDSIITYHHSCRLPTFVKNWRPLLFIINKTTFTVRLTTDLALLLTRENDESTTINVTSIDFNKGFCCSHPKSEYGIAYGSYIIKSLRNCIEIPEIYSSGGPWGFFVQFCDWGGIVIPKEIEYSTPSNIISSMISKGNDKIATIFHPPNILLHIHISGPRKFCRQLAHGRDFGITAIKESVTDLNIYLVIDGQTIVYNFSFDIRINKPGGMKVNKVIKLKAVRSEKDKSCNTLAFKSCKDVTVPINSGSPTRTEFGHLLSNQVLAIFDAETSQYLTHPPGMAICNVFNKLAIPAN